MKNFRNLLALTFVCTSFLIALSAKDAHAVPFEKVDVSCELAPGVHRIVDCGMQFGGVGHAALMAQSETVMDTLTSLDWKNHVAYSCEVKMGSFALETRPVYAVQNCTPK